jgi:hypothetical protein
MSDTENTPRTAADALSDLESLIQGAADHAIPVNFPHALGLLVEHAKLSTHDDVSALAARVEAVEKTVSEALMPEAAPAATVEGASNPPL